MNNSKENNTEIVTVFPYFPKDSSSKFKDDIMSDSSYYDLELKEYPEDSEIIVVHGNDFDQLSDNDLEFSEDAKLGESTKSKLNDANSSDVIVQTDILNDQLDGGITETTKKLLKSTEIPTQNKYRSTYSNNKNLFKVRPIRPHLRCINKGLRHFSKRVCDKVKTKMVTTYQEVADELVAECFGNNQSTNCLYDEKNIKRRIYDSLNVLIALDIITKKNKDIIWKGLPTDSIPTIKYLVKEKENRVNSVKRKLLAIQETIMQEVAVKQLVKRNVDMENDFGLPPDNTFVNLSFLAVSAAEETAVEVEISDDQKQYVLNFSDDFSVVSDTELLKSMGFTLGLDCGEVSDENLKLLKTLVPKAFEKHIEMMATKNEDMINDICKEFDEKTKSIETEKTSLWPNIISRTRSMN